MVTGAIVGNEELIGKKYNRQAVLQQESVGIGDCYLYPGRSRRVARFHAPEWQKCWYYFAVLNVVDAGPMPVNPGSKQ